MADRMRKMISGKIHRATDTGANLHYVGSVTIDADLFDAADILPGESIDIVDANNGKRLTALHDSGRARQRRDHPQRRRRTPK